MLGCSQPAVTRTIQDLEAELGSNCCTVSVGGCSCLKKVPPSRRKRGVC
ncbi:LysR family transcriptional regulator [Mesorhizobium sp. M0114]